MKQLPILGLILLVGCMHSTSDYTFESSLKASFDFQKQSIDIDGTRIKYVDAGEGRPIVLIHGNPTSSYLWRHVIAQLAKKNRVIAADLPGMGDSASISVDTFDLLSFQLETFDKFMEKLKLKRAIFVGQDWGGLLALDQSSKPRAAGLVLFEFVQQNMAKKLGFVASIFWNTSVARYLTESDFIDNRRALTWVQKLSHRELSKEELDHYYRPFEDKKRLKITYDWFLNLCVDGSSKESCRIVNKVYEKAKVTGIPKLLLWFNQGRLISNKKEALETASRFEKMEVGNIGDGIHYVQEDQPTNISDKIQLWIKKNSL